MSKRSFHQVLGVEPTATLEQIRTAYRKKCVLVHPDRNTSSTSTEEFRELNEAYQALTDPSAIPSLFLPPPSMHFPLANYNLMIPNDEERQVNVSIADFYTGSQHKVHVTVRRLCQSCFVTGPFPTLCKACDGKGRVPKSAFTMYRGMMLCKRCDGTGLSGACADCAGARVKMVSKTLSVRLPPRSDPQQPIVFPEYGHQYRENNTNKTGALRIKIVISNYEPPGAAFSADKETGNVYVKHPIKLGDLLCGNTTTVTVPGGEQMVLVLPDPTEMAKFIVVPNAGLYKESNLCVKLTVEMPSRSHLHDVAGLRKLLP